MSKKTRIRGKPLENLKGYLEIDHPEIEWEKVARGEKSSNPAVLELTKDDQNQSKEYHKRRAMIFKIVRDKGSQSFVSKSDLATYFDCDRTTIWHDFNALAPLWEESLKLAKSDVSLALQTLLRESMKMSLVEERVQNATRVIRELRQWGVDTGIIEKQADKLELSGQSANVVFNLREYADEESEE